MGAGGDGAGAGGVAARAAGEPDGNALAGQIREAREQLARFREEHDPNDAEHRKLLGPYRRARACAFCAGDRPGDLARFAPEPRADACAPAAGAPQRRWSSTRRSWNASRACGYVRPPIDPAAPGTSTSGA